MALGKSKSQRRKWEFAVGDSVFNEFDCQTLGAANGCFTGVAVTHYAWKLEHFRNPASVFFPIQFNR